MTIGAYDYDVSQGPNPDFLKLVSCRKTICDEISLKEQELELSMGMSADFEQAVSTKRKHSIEIVKGKRRWDFTVHFEAIIIS